MIEVRDLSTGYNGAFRLQGIAFQMRPGAFWGIIGPNGSGKSTLLKTISRVLEPQSGSVRLSGTPIGELSYRELARRMAVVGSEAHFAFPFRVRDVVMMGRIPFAGRLQSFTTHDCEAVEIAMKKTEAWEFRDRYVHHLSSGERQRVLLARALAQEPKILLLDEPTAHLDLHYEIEIFRILKMLHESEGLTVLTVSHNLNLVAEFCEQLIVLEKGRSITIGPPADVLTPILLRDVFRIECNVSTNPFSKAPVILINTQQ
jgi:iron complex transport system ATP-binding protein